MSIDFAHMFAVQIARTARDIDAVIESLPNDEQSLELQVNDLPTSEWFNNSVF